MGWINSAQFDRDHSGQRDVCAADGHPATTADPLTLTDDGYRVHTSHLADEASGFHGQQQTDDDDGM